MASFLSGLKRFFHDWAENRRIKADKRRIERQRRDALRRQEQQRIEAERRRAEEHKRQMYHKGNEFEDYVKGMFPEDRFTLIHRTPTNDDAGGRYVHSMIYPDLRFIDKSTGRKFWVEVKYRSHAESDGSIVWCADNQLTNYKRTMYESRCKVFIIMGVGGTVQRPDKVYCLDLENINFTKLFYGTYKNHRIMFGTVESLRQLEYIANLDHPRSLLQDLRECRRTFGQRYLDQNLELSSVSVLMGHSSTRTTERFYGRQKNIMAIEKARATWDTDRDQTSSRDSTSPTGRE